jgi:hypothetical protein
MYHLPGVINLIVYTWEVLELLYVLNLMGGGTRKSGLGDADGSGILGASDIS